MIVNLRLGEPIWRKINQRKLKIDQLVSGISVYDFITELGQRYPELAEEMLGESGDLDFHFSLILNGCQTRWSDSKQTSLSDGDEIMIILPLSGG